MPTYKNITADTIELLYDAVKIQIDWETGEDTPIEEIQAMVNEYLSAQQRKQEAKDFIDAHPNALQLIQLPPDDLELAIENRTAGQETLLLKTMAFAVRFLYDTVNE